jgi:hypothetical protein
MVNNSDTLYIGFTPGKNFGWGITCSYLVDELSKLTKIELVDKIEYAYHNR